MLFSKEIDGWDCWGKLFCDLETFAPLCREILAKENLGNPKLGRLTPGTNAVFSAGHYVLKIFAPKETGLNTTTDFYVEQQMLFFAAQLQIHTPRLIAFGELQDRYHFRYLVLERVKGFPGDRLFTLEKSQQSRILEALVKDMLRLHAGVPEKPLRQWLTSPVPAQNNPRWEKISPGLRKELFSLTEEAIPMQVVLVPVHGDLTRDNLILSLDETQQAQLIWIDFADSHLAPECYELPPVVFELLMGDRKMVRLFYDIYCGYCGIRSRKSFLEQLVLGLAIHDFGADILKSYFSRCHKGQRVDSVKSLMDLLDGDFF